MPPPCVTKTGNICPACTFRNEIDPSEFPKLPQADHFTLSRPGRVNIPPSNFFGVDSKHVSQKRRKTTTCSNVCNFAMSHTENKLGTRNYFGNTPFSELKRTSCFRWRSFPRRCRGHLLRQFSPSTSSPMPCGRALKASSSGPSPLTHCQQRQSSQ